MAKSQTGNTPKTWNKLRGTLKRSQLRRARKEAERRRKAAAGVGIAPGLPQAQSTAHHPFRRLRGRSMAWEGVFIFLERSRVRER